MVTEVVARESVISCGQYSPLHIAFVSQVKQNRYIPPLTIALDFYCMHNVIRNADIAHLLCLKTLRTVCLIMLRYVYFFLQEHTDT